MSIDDDSNKAFDARTMIAIVLMVVVITAGMAVQNYFFPRQPLPVEPTAATGTAQPAATASPAAMPAASVTVATAEAPATAPGAAAGAIAGMSGEAAAPLAEATHTVSTAMYDAVLTNRGGQLVSLKVKNQSGGPVEMLLPVNGELEGFSLALGGADAAPLDVLMNVNRPLPGVIEFSRLLVSTDATGTQVPFTLRKRYEFPEHDYMFKLSVTVESATGAVPAIGSGTAAWTLTIGPQIGPDYIDLPKNADFRKIITYEKGKRKIQKAGTVAGAAGQASWSAIAGKYFTIAVIPEVSQYASTYTTTMVNSKPGQASMAFSRQALTASTQTDVFYVYAGPKSQRELARYDDPTANAYKKTGTDLEGILEGGSWLGWLEVALKWSLNLFYGIVHNYGVAIILVTLLVRLIMFPLTFRGSQSTARMAELQPKLQELQAKYKNNPQKLNAEMADFYKKEGYNPLSGCLPLLIQFPIFIAMYALFNNHFDLRGASFIPGWINDLSLPEAIVTFPTVNLVLWQVSAIRLLPIIYVASQLLYGRFMQQTPTTGQNAGQMKFMMYGMPIIFFFVLYDVPSGLLVYWISSNVLTIVQQVIINQVVHKKRTGAGGNGPDLKIVPPKGQSQGPKSVKKGK